MKEESENKEEVKEVNYVDMVKELGNIRQGIDRFLDKFEKSLNLANLSQQKVEGSIFI